MHERWSVRLGGKLVEVFLVNWKYEVKAVCSYDSSLHDRIQSRRCLDVWKQEELECEVFSNDRAA